MVDPQIQQHDASATGSAPSRKIFVDSSFSDFFLLAICSLMSFMIFLTCWGHSISPLISTMPGKFSLR
jgi:hypothetical protein